MSCTDVAHQVPVPTDDPGDYLLAKVAVTNLAACPVCGSPCRHVSAFMTFETPDGDEIAVGCCLCGIRLDGGPTSA